MPSNPLFHYTQPRAPFHLSRYIALAGLYLMLGVFTLAKRKARLVEVVSVVVYRKVPP